MAIVSRRCDVPMARRKGLLNKCKKDCRHCLCCIEMNEWGRESHVDTVRGGDPGLLARNLSRYSPRIEKPTGNRRIGPFFGGKHV